MIAAKRTSVAGLLLACAAMLFGPAGMAHHSFASEFSRDLPVEVTGTVVRLDWRNPHARLYVETEGEGGERVEWDFELITPNILMRQGWSPNVVQRGDKVTVTGWRARNAPHVANAGSVTLENGKRLFSGSADGED